MQTTAPDGTKPKRRSRAFRASSRATLLWGAVALIIVQVAFRFAIDQAWPQLRDPSFEIKARRLDAVLAQHPHAPIILMTGSSVTSNSFKAKHLEDQLTGELKQDIVVFNMGCHGGGPLTQLLWMRRLVERGVHPDLVVVEVSPHLYQTLETSRFPAHVLTRDDLRAIRPYVTDPELRRDWRWHRWIPVYFHRLTIMNVAAITLVPIKDRLPTWGGTIDQRCWTALPPRSPEALAYNVRQMVASSAPPLRDFTPAPSCVQALQTLLALLEREHIPAAVVMAPQSPAFRQLYHAQNMERFVTQVALLSEQHQAAFLNASAWLEEEHFADCIHPTSVGAEIFSTRLKQEVLLPTLEKERERRGEGEKGRRGEGERE